MGDVVGGIFGSGSDSGLLGTGQYRTDGYKIDRSAFDASPEEQQLMAALKSQAMGQSGNIALSQGLDAANNNAMALASSQRGINPALAARLASQQQATNQQSANIAGVQLQQAQQGNYMNALQGQSQRSQNREALESSNANATAGVNAQAYEGAAGRRQGAMQGLGQAIGMGFADGGMVPQQTMNPFFEKYLQAASSVPQINTSPAKSSPSDFSGFAKALKGSGAEAGAAPDAMSLAGNPQMLMPLALQSGGAVPGEAHVEGDSPANDTVPAKLSPGEIVIPRTIVKKGPDAAAKFVAAILAKEKSA